jgi:hypothetical protein
MVPGWNSESSKLVPHCLVLAPSSEIASLRSAYDDMSDKPCDKCNTIMVKYAYLCLVHSRIASLLDGARLELRELKARSTLLGT